MTVTIDGTTGIASVDGSAGAPSVRGSDSNSGIVYAADTVSISTGGTERVEVDSSGNVDIPDNGKIRLGTGNDLSLYHDGSHSIIEESGTGGLKLVTDHSFQLRNGNKDTGEYLINANVDGAAELYFNGTKRFETEANSCKFSGSYVSFGDTGYIRTDDSNFLAFQSGSNGTSFRNNSNSEFGRVNNSGNWYLGMTPAAEPSSSQRGIRISGQTTGFPVYWQSSSEHHNGNYSHLQFFTDQGSCGTINANGSSTTYNTSSDYRLKENQVSISNGITRLKQLKPYRFNWKHTPEVFQDGFFAHEAQAVVPEAVSGTKDEMKSLYYEEGDTIPSGKNVGDFKEFSTTEINPQGIDHSKLVPLLTAALQEAVTKIETLEAKVAALEAA